jgi:hypothetical protein
MHIFDERAKVVTLKEMKNILRWIERFAHEVDEI